MRLKKPLKRRNYPAKHARLYSTAKTFRDRKRSAKAGYRKHRGA